MSRLKEYDKTAFHIHTKRCRHGSNELDEKYIKTAIDLGLERIVFTDHGPFKGDPFTSRMYYKELPEYISSINELSKKYEEEIEVICGLEIEYFKNYDSYYEELLSKKGLDLLILGQHFYSISNSLYSFKLSKEELVVYEADGLVEAILAGIESGYFKVVAHPDRSFREKSVWTEHEEDLAKSIINTALEYNILLEKNVSSIRVTERFDKHHYWSQFWRLTTQETSYLYGLDSHETSKLSSGYTEYQEPLIKMEDSNVGKY